mmetsp:Transcript_2311/g.6296  ORF Transcript_2311/g.6296 Transcript_2311/m.6296 type:complete len:275 (-) Transcript_2311:1380-2204(-)
MRSMKAMALEQRPTAASKRVGEGVARSWARSPQRCGRDSRRVLARAGEREAGENAERCVDAQAQQLGRREAFARACVLASTATLAGQISFEPPSSLLVASAAEEPPFAIDVPNACPPPAEAPPATEVSAEVEGEAAAPAPPPPPADCGASLGTLDVQSNPSGLKYKDLKVGDGELPPVGYQVVVNYVVMTPDGKLVSSTLESGFPVDVRVGSGSIIAGLDEGLLSMRSGGYRRLYVPGELSFQERLASAPGRAALPAQSPLIIDVNLVYIPGVD